MQSQQEYSEGQIRRFMTILFVARAKRHLKTLAEVYGWTPAQLTEYEERFIKIGEHVPVWI
jgi:hypothetical protein